MVGKCGSFKYPSLFARIEDPIIHRFIARQICKLNFFQKLGCAIQFVCLFLQMNRTSGDDVCLKKMMNRVPASIFCMNCKPGFPDSRFFD